MLISNADHGIALVGNVLVQVRRGPLTLELLESVAGWGRAARLKQGGSLGLLGVIEEQAAMTTAPVRSKQNEIARSLLVDPRTRVAIVYVGDGAVAMMKRTIGRLIAGSITGQRRVFDDIPPAIAWMAAELSTDAVAIKATLDHLRRPPFSR
jgi:hypothetical protein